MCIGRRYVLPTRFTRSRSEEPFVGEPAWRCVIVVYFEDVGSQSRLLGTVAALVESGGGQSKERSGTRFSGGRARRKREVGRSRKVFFRSCGNRPQELSSLQQPGACSSQAGKDQGSNRVAEHG